MRIEHVAIWCRDLEALKAFYQAFFGAKAGRKYTNRTKDFQSYFLSFDSGARLELMHMPSVRGLTREPGAPSAGLAHLAFAVGSEDGVVQLTEKLRQAGHRVVDEPRRTGDGYYESVVLDPEGNRIEITV